MSFIDPRLGQIKSCLYRVSLKAIIVLHGRLLLTQERSGRYNLPGGGLEYDEDSTETALLRELQEEVGLDPSNVTIAPEIVRFSHRGMLYNIPWLNVYYRAHITDQSAVRDAELKLRWVTAQELKHIELSPAVAHDRDFLVRHIA